MKRNVLSLLFCFAVVLSFIGSGEGLAAPYYEGKRITIIVGTNPGGGYDQTARFVAKYLPRYIPGKPTVIVENMPGAGHMIAANHVYNLAKPDGLTIGTFNRALPFAQLTKAEGVRFDFRKYSWIGSPTVDPTVFFIRSDLPIQNVEDLKKTKEIPVGTEGLGTTSHHFSLLLKNFVGINFKLVVYTSGSDARLAVERKEVDGRIGSYSQEKRYVERGLFRPLIRGRVSLPEIETLVVNEDLTTDPKGKTIMGMLSSVDRAARPYVAPPGTPAEVMNILREALAKITEDPEAREEAKKLSMDLQFVSPAECAKVLDYLFGQPEDIVKEFRRFITF
jgi:tripartite-type tricarboxylate transporter receptor subunit TctC